MIYFIRANGTEFVKIGYVRGDVAAVESRRRELQCGCPHELIVLACLPGGQSDEARLHTLLSALRTRGEWFSFTGSEATSDLVRLWAAHVLEDAEVAA